MSLIEKTGTGSRARVAFDASSAPFVVTLVLGAALLFAIQPMFAKMALPLFGGAPAVWTSAMVFFQAALLAGYGYAHVSVRLLPPRAQVAVHAALLALAFASLPIGLQAGATPPGTATPVLTLLGMMAVTVGPPFAVLSATAPLLQKWYAATGFRGSEDPYHLYAASNTGSLTALLAYPFLIEPLFELPLQSRHWAEGFVVLAGLVVGCGGLMLRHRRPAAFAPSTDGEGQAPAVTTRERFQWVALAFVPSSLFLGATTHITTDIAPVPLLWIVPLALYLLSFVFAFAARPPLRLAWVVWATPFVVVVGLIVFKVVRFATVPFLATHLAILFTLCLMCHGELAKRRPHPSRLTEFYWLVSVGGVLGGVFNAIVAPLVFSDVVEYPLAIALACLLLPPRNRPDGLVPALVRAGALLLAFVGLAVATRQSPAIVGLIGYALLAVVAFGWSRRPIRFGLAVAVLAVGPFMVGGQSGASLVQTRNFFGIKRVAADRSGDFRLLFSGTTLHGAEAITATGRPEPLSYYDRQGPAGQVFAAIDPGRLRRVGVVGLGTGSLACYRQPHQAWTFFEIDPGVVDIAASGRYFTFLKDCAPDAAIVLGDARLSLAREPSGRFDLLILDAFSSDAIPVHLLTREAFALYADVLSADGILLVHISNRYLDLSSLVAGVAAAGGLRSLLQYDERSEDERKRFISSSRWMLLSRDPTIVSSFKQDRRWSEVVAGPSVPVWTDSYSNLVHLFRWTRH